MDFVRKMVSKKKRRFEWGNFDLDLTYINDRIIAMGFPSESIEGLYRNNMKDVQRFFNTLHFGHYKVYNLCSERKYPHDKFANNVSEYPFDDHNPPNLQTIVQFCEDVERWLEEHPENVAAIHCKAGKGRTGTMIACWLLYNRSCQTGSESIRMFGNKRTHNGKGITIPSQARYVRYFEALLQYGRPIPPVPNDVTKILSTIRINPLPNFNISGGCEPYLSIGQQDKSVFYTKPMKLRKGTHIVEIDCGNIILSNDVKIQFYNKNSKGHMFSFCFHTAFVEGSKMHIRRQEIDKAHKDSTHKHFHPNFSIELQFAEDLEEDLEELSSSIDSSSNQSESSTTSNNNSNTSQFVTTFQTGLTKLYKNNGKAESPLSKSTDQSQQSQQKTPDLNNKTNNNQQLRDRNQSIKLFTCPKCNEMIYPNEVSLNDGHSNYHWKCMRCNKCQRSLQNESDCLFQENGQIHCSECATNSGFFKQCAGCQKVIKTSDFEEVGELNFHRTCFCCSVCFNFLSNQEFIIKDNHLECIKCVEREKNFYKGLTLSDKVLKNLSLDEKTVTIKPKQVEDKQPEQQVEPVKEDEKENDTSLISCQKCQKSVGLRPLILDIGIWHKECFSCTECDNVIDTSIYYIRNEQPICCDCDKRLNKIDEFFCYACKELINDEEMMEAIGEKWHVDCLVCSVCKKQIDGPFGDDNGVVYCKEHYEEIFGTKCSFCKNIIVGTYLKVNGKNLHSNCFKCSICDYILEGGKYYSRGNTEVCEKCRHVEIQKRRTQIQLIGSRNTLTSSGSNSTGSMSSITRSNYSTLNSSGSTWSSATSSAHNNNVSHISSLLSSPNNNNNSSTATVANTTPTTETSTSTSPNSNGNNQLTNSLDKSSPEPSESYLFVRKPSPPRQSVRVNINDIKKAGGFGFGSFSAPDKNNKPSTQIYPSFHRQMQRQISNSPNNSHKNNENDSNNNNNTSSPFRAARPTKNNTLRRDFLSSLQQQ